MEPIPNSSKPPTLELKELQSTENGEVSEVITFSSFFVFWWPLRSVLAQFLGILTFDKGLAKPGGDAFEISIQNFRSI